MVVRRDSTVIALHALVGVEGWFGSVSTNKRISVAATRKLTFRARRRLASLPQPLTVLLRLYRGSAGPTMDQPDHESIDGANVSP